MISRQVARAAGRKNDYWVPGPQPYLCWRPATARGCRLISTTGRQAVSARVIAAKRSLKRTAPPPEPRYPAHMRHAWQRVAHSRAELQKLLAQ